MSTPFHSPEPASGDAPLRIAVLGAGPVGLDAALAAREAGHAVRVYEAAPTPADNVRSWGHVRLFTPWRMNLSERMWRGLEEMGIELGADPEATPTGHEYADRALDPLWTLPGLDTALRTGRRVVAVGRQGTLKHEEIGTPERGRRPFRLLVAEVDVDPAGAETIEYADVVLDCTGRHAQPNTLGDGGIPAPGERRLDPLISHRIPDVRRDAEAWEGRTVLLVGAGHSAQTAAQALAELGSGGGANGSSPSTKVLWALRRERPDWGAVEDDPLPERRRLTDAAAELAAGASPAVEPLAGVVVEGVEHDGSRFGVRLRATDGRIRRVEVDRVLGLTGGVGDHGLYRQLQVHECYATSGPMKLAAELLGSAAGDCLQQESHGVEALSHPEPGFYLLGDKSYGRNNTFLLQVGWSQVDEVFGALAPPVRTGEEGAAPAAASEGAATGRAARKPAATEPAATERASTERAARDGSA